MSDETKDVVRIASMVTVSPQALADAAFDLNAEVSRMLARRLNDFAVAERLEVLLDSLKVEATDGGFWSSERRTWLQRLLRRPARQVWVPMVRYRASAKAVAR